jgi:beta-phosphoglucomutase-like phosphatase (HAD superfamily)
VEPKEIIVIEGVTTLYQELRELNDIAFFLDALEETQLKSRIGRDVNKRGYSVEEAIALYHTLKPTYKEFIEPTKEYADVIFEVEPDYIMRPIHIHKKLRATAQIVAKTLQENSITFDVVVTGEEFVSSKPHPESYNLALHKVDLCPQEVLIIEDSPAGIEAGKQAGCKVIGLRTYQDDLSYADWQCDNHHQVLELLKKLL